METSLKTLVSILEILLARIQTGLTLSDIENALFFILFVRFLILSIRYNLKTSFYITCIGLFAGYLWYRHLVDIILVYRNILFKIPFLSGLGIDAIQMRFTNHQMTLGELTGDKSTDFSREYSIDPISMIISKLNEPYKSKIWPLYYKIYNKILPKVFFICTKFWTQISGVAAYVFLTRIGKKYCPYLVRWHWTFLIILGLVEQPLISLVSRLMYFQAFILVPKSSIFQIHALNFGIACILLSHIGFIIFGLFHAIWGQYFYFPFLVENTELHIGPRPRNSIYSGGETAWQYPDEKNIRLFTTLWFGWFGHGKKRNNKNYYSKKKRSRKIIKRFIRKFLRRIKKILGR